MFFFYGSYSKSHLRKPCTPWKINFERGPKGTVKVYVTNLQVKVYFTNLQVKVYFTNLQVKVYFTNLQIKVYFTNLQIKVYFTKGGFPLSRNFYVRTDVNFNWLYVHELK